MSVTEDFLTPQEEREIVEAIGIAEKNTSGEIRVHIEKRASIAPMDRAIEIFNSLKMYETKDRNGVLIYVAYQSKVFAICGDRGINEVVPTDFWDCTKEVMLTEFKNNNFKKGLIDGVLRAGEQLKIYFPYQADDVNELSNEISKG